MQSKSTNLTCYCSNCAFVCNFLLPIYTNKFLNILPCSSECRLIVDFLGTFTEIKNNELLFLCLVTRAVKHSIFDLEFCSFFYYFSYTLWLFFNFDLSNLKFWFVMYFSVFITLNTKKNKRSKVHLVGEKMCIFMSQSKTLAQINNNISLQVKFYGKKERKKLTKIDFFEVNSKRKMMQNGIRSLVPTKKKIELKKKWRREIWLEKLSNSRKHYVKTDYEYCDKCRTMSVSSSTVAIQISSSSY